ncbi:uncharacterized protein LOC115929229 isoform X2 [Strongylocentrotus purpuratus]|uniref:Uncharacterized protein n=1 Tax=Strongylocentrotus purpuratus TaxID=7668 RepID=A0A7M7PNF5_STRPU|nr:uncharacterized protein LOC115929229 isoform X2 [Strongylocentrotus purpuratus]
MPSPSRQVLNNNSPASGSTEPDSLLQFSPPCRMVESVNNNHSIEEKDDMLTFSMVTDIAGKAMPTTTTTTTTDVKMLPLIPDGFVDGEHYNEVNIGLQETMFEGSVEHKNNSNHSQQDFFCQFDTSPTILDGVDDDDHEEQRLSSTHSSPTLSHHECIQIDSKTYSAPNSPHGKPPFSRHPKKKLVRRQSSPPTSSANAETEEDPEDNQTASPDSPSTRTKFRRSFFKRFSAGNKEELQGKSRALSVRERKVQKKPQPETKKKARRTFSVGDDQLMRIRQQQPAGAKSTNSNSNIFASVKEEDEATSAPPPPSSPSLPGQPAANQESAFEDVFTPNSLTETQKKARNM